MTESPLRIAGIAGSLRTKSFNRGLLRAAAAVTPAGVSLEIADIGALPLYDEDVRAAGEPAAVTQLKDAVRAQLAPRQVLLFTRSLVAWTRRCNAPTPAA